MTHIEYRRRVRGDAMDDRIDADDAARGGGCGGGNNRLGERAREHLINSGQMDIRGKIAADVPFITNSWLKSYRDQARFVGNDVYYTNHHELISRLWNDPGAVWLVAVSAKYPTYILGYLCGEMSDRGPIIHYVYTRFEVEGGLPLRRLGIATRLVETFLEGVHVETSENGRPVCRVWYTHHTPVGAACLRGRSAEAMGANAGFEYNPYLAWTKLG